MRFPGGFLEPSDFPVATDYYGRTRSYIPISETQSVSFTWGVGGDRIIFTNTLHPHPRNLFPNNYLLSRNMLWYEVQEFKLETYYEYFTNFVVQSPSQSFEKEDILARLESHNGIIFSPRTIRMVNEYFQRQYLGSRAFTKWLNNNSALPWVFSRYERMFIPKKLCRRNPHLTGVQASTYYWRYREPISGWQRLITMGNLSQGERTRLHSYNTRATEFLDPIIDPQDTSDVMYGIELEFEGLTQNNMLQLADLVDDYAILKRDGSLNNGVEVCTTPAAFEIHKEKLKTIYDQLPTGLRSEYSTGMHIHISREPLSFLQLGKIFAFVNHEKNNNLVEHIAGRPANNYCRRSDISNMISAPYTNMRGRDRYRRINLQNDRTIEFRIFSTPMEYNDALYKLEFCKSMVDYTAPGVVSLQHITESDEYFEFLYKTRKDYPTLYKFLNI